MNAGTFIAVFLPIFIVVFAKVFSFMVDSFGRGFSLYQIIE